MRNSNSARPQPVTYADYKIALRTSKYLRRRWPYYRQVIALTERIKPQRVLEIGIGPLPLFHGSDKLDVNASFRPSILHDATVVPWPVATKSYDLIVALQVFEHLEGKQFAAFQELRRCTRHAILSIPYRWPAGSDPSHEGIDDARVRSWTAADPVETRTVPRWNIFRRRRRIYLFDFTADCSESTQLRKPTPQSRRAG